VEPDVTVVVLAGGRSTRFGGDKRQAVIDGRDLVTRAIDLAREVSVRVILSVGHGEAAAFRGRAGVEVVEDAAPDLGPLSGIAAGMRSSATALVAFLPVDCPFVPAGLLRRLVEAAGEGGAVVDDGRGIQPLIACYPSARQADVEAAVARGERAVHRVVAAWDPARLGIDEVARFGDPARVLANVNTSDDLDAIGGGGRVDG
jgi:molybdopterin-guanine dinucleotide biosynthesis protein A